MIQTAIPFLIGTKFDQFATFPRDEQEEITKQVSPATCLAALPSSRIVFLPGKTVCPSNARVTDILFNFSINKRAKNLQNCFGEGFRSEMCDS
jgi:hypothetical protein